MLQKLAIFLCIFTMIHCKSTKNNKATTLSEAHRPQFHFTPPKMWMNDPNGMVFYEGEYHLFYQHYPEATIWGAMHWGHAVSKDMVHWEHLPIALYPDDLGMIFSGSAVVDWKNDSGFGVDGKPPLVAIFTHHLMEAEKAGKHDFQYQSLAYSNDKGRNWTKYTGNPVIPNTDKIHDFRDPKVSYDADSKQWLMVFAAGNHTKIWGSQDLKNWKHLSDFGKEYGDHSGVWECPDFFQMVVDNGETMQKQQKKWVLLQSLNPGSPNGGSGTQYFVGDFDGKKFTLDPSFAKSVMGGKAQWLDFGRDNYAGVTWSDIPKRDGRRLFLGWMSNWDYAQQVPTDKWRSAMTLPRELTLKQSKTGFQLISQPVRELKTLRKNHFVIDKKNRSGTFNLSEISKISPKGMELEISIENTENQPKNVEIVLSNAKKEEYKIGFDANKNQFYSDRTKAGKHDFSDKFATKIHIAPRISSSKKIKMHLFFDVASCELFADDGTVVMTDIFFPNGDFTTINIIGEGIFSGDVWELMKNN
jgi:fructan beta-fructosidase